MLLCARSVLRRGGLAPLLRRCGGDGECATGAGEALANARCVGTLAALGGGGRALERRGRWADPLRRVGKADPLCAGPMTRVQTRSFLGCGDGEEGSVLSKVYEERRVMGYAESI
jgi:coenzyme Q-binding protein COQ10